MHPGSGGEQCGHAVRRLGLIGSATAAALQSRFAATDLATPASRGRDLSLVVWSTTIGAVTGPNLAKPGDLLGAAIGLPPLAGVFVFPLIAQLVAAGVYTVWMRPDPLLESRRLADVVNRESSDTGAVDPPGVTRRWSGWPCSPSR